MEETILLYLHKAESFTVKFPNFSFSASLHQESSSSDSVIGACMFFHAF